MLPLETWRQAFGFNPYHFWQLQNSEVPVTSTCRTLVREYAWQAADAVGRSEIRAAIASAEKRLREHLGYRVSPGYVTEEVSWPRYHGAGLYNGSGAGSDGRWLTVRAGEGYVQAIGVETFTLLGTGAVAYSDENVDGVTDTFEVTVNDDVEDTGEVEVYFTLADRMNNEIAERYRIAPVTVESGGGTTTVTGPSWLCVRPIKYEGVSTGGLNPDSTDAGSAIFAQNLEVYRHYTDPTGTTTDDAQATLIWESSPWPGWACCNDAGTDPAGQAYAIARAQVRDKRLGIIAIGAGSYNADTGVWSAGSWNTCHPPDRIILRYRAGLETESVQGGSWSEIVARFAAAELVRPICACESANKELHRWQTDRARISGANDEMYRMSDSELSNPFGARAGAIYAWNQVKHLRLTPGLAVG